MMIVLHGGVFKEEFFLWGEIPGDLDAQTALKLGRKRNPGAALSVPQLLRYDAGTERLSIAFKEIGLCDQGQ